MTLILLVAALLAGSQDVLDGLTSQSASERSAAWKRLRDEGLPKHIDASGRAISLGSRRGPPADRRLLLEEAILVLDQLKREGPLDSNGIHQLAVAHFHMSTLTKGAVKFGHLKN